MNRNLMNIVVFLILLVIFVTGFSNSYTSHNISNLAYVLAIGIDKGEKAKLKISAQFSKSAIFSSESGSSSEDASNIILVSGEADSIFSGLNLLNSYIGKELNLAHCSVIIFSEEFAKEGISTEIFSLINNEEVRPSTNLVISKCSAYDYLNNSIPNLEKMTIKYYDTFSITSRFTGYISNLTIGDFYNDMASSSCDSTAILGGLNSTARKENSEKSNESSSGSSNSSSGEGSSGSSSSNSSSGSGGSSGESETTNNSSQNMTEEKNVVTNSEDLTAGTSSVVGKRGTENIGIAVFDEDKLCGELTAVEAICHLLITNKVDSFIISIDNPMVEDKKMDLQIYPVKDTKVTVDTKGDSPRISININVDADIMTLEDNIDYGSKENLEKFSKSSEDYLKSQLDDYLKKVSRDFGTDIDHFCVKALQNFATIPEWKKYNWVEKFKNAEFDVNIDVNVVSSMLITRT